MTSATFRRLSALLAAVALLGWLIVAVVAAPASAKGTPTCAGRTATIVGTDKGEVIVGTSNDDVIVARGGNDRVYGRGGDDIICGGLGRDLLIGGAGRDRLYGDDGQDTLRGNAGLDRLYGGAGDDQLYGGTGPDTLDGGADDDFLDGYRGRDRLYGRRGDDDLRGQNGADILRGGPGSDVLAGMLDDDRLYGGTGHDLLIGGGGTDTCIPGPGSGPHLNCEVWPKVEPQDLAIAWSDLDGDHHYGPGDVLISRLFDTNGDGVPSRGDTIYMGRYPLDFGATAFSDWGVASHEVLGATNFSPPSPSAWPWLPYDLTKLGVQTASGRHFWTDLFGGWYGEQTWSNEQGNGVSEFTELGPADSIHVRTGSPSLPGTEVILKATGDAARADAPFIDTVVYP